MKCYTCGRDFDILYSCPECKSEAGYCGDHRYDHEHVKPDPKPEPEQDNQSQFNRGQTITTTNVWRRVENSYTTGSEWKDLALATFLITLTFSIIFLIAPNIPNISLPTVLELKLMLVIGVTASTAFLGHELSHKVVAQRYGHDSRFVLNVIYISFSLVLAIAGWFSVIMGVAIIFSKGAMTEDEMGIISSSGSFANFVMGSTGLAVLMFLGPAGSSLAILDIELITIISYFIRINGAIGAIYMLPFGHLDGAKIWAWNKSYFAFLAVGNLLLWFVA